MNANLLNRINKKMAIYKGCTLEEVMSLGISYFFVTTPVAIIILKLTINMAMPAIIIGLLLSIILTQSSTKIIEKYKDGKPDGYLSQSLRLLSTKIGIGSSKFIIRQGKWSVGRTK